MTSFEDKAQSSRPVLRAAEAAGAYRLDDADELTPASEIGDPDEFPQYGDFADVTEVGMDGSTHEAVWLETPSDLAAGLLEAGIGEGELFVVRHPDKDDRGNWSFTVEAADDVEELTTDD